jgi:hypothetical protein
MVESLPELPMLLKTCQLLSIDSGPFIEADSKSNYVLAFRRSLHSLSHTNVGASPCPIVLGRLQRGARVALRWLGVTADPTGCLGVAVNLGKQNAAFLP